MATYTYTGRLTDLGESPFPEAYPRLWVEPEKTQPFGPFTPSGPGADRRITIPLASNGTFSVDLVASADLIPPTRYILRCDWFMTGSGGDEVLTGWSEWRFTALIGGGPLSTMPDAPVTRVWFSTTPPPVNRPGVIWVNPVTGDVREWSD